MITKYTLLTVELHFLSVILKIIEPVFVEHCLLQCFPMLPITKSYWVLHSLPCKSFSLQHHFNYKNTVLELFHFLYRVTLHLLPRFQLKSNRKMETKGKRRFLNNIHVLNYREESHYN